MRWGASGECLGEARMGLADISGEARRCRGEGGDLRGAEIS